MKSRVLQVDLLSNGAHKGVESDNALQVFVLTLMDRVTLPLPHNAGLVLLQLVLARCG